MAVESINQKLCELCTVENPDFEAIEDLLKAGANPMGLVDYYEVGETYLFDFVVDYWLDISMCKNENVPEITEITRLFLKYGMNLNNPDYNFDDDDKSNPMSTLGFYGGKDFLRAYKLILDKGLNADNADACWGHDYDDHYLSNYDDSDFERIMLKDLVFKMLITLAYPKSRNEYLEKHLQVSDNDYDVSKFKDWEKYDMNIDASKRPGKRINGTIITVFEKESGNTVWRFIM